MAKWADLLTLIAVEEPGNETDAAGFYAPPVETKREVLANRKSVGYAEFYKSASAGYTAELKLALRTMDYGGERLVEYEGKRYRVLRTYESTNGDIIELTLTDLSERAGTTPAPSGEEKGGGNGG